jgi:hypothetical protein
MSSSSVTMTDMSIINVYVDKLIENLPDTSKNIGNIDLVLEGGLFNGSYLVGALYFLKEMEKRKYVTIDRISGCSIGSIIGFLYYIDSLYIIFPLYQKLYDAFKNTRSLRILTSIKTYLKPYIPPDICSKINNKLYICYHNIKKQKKVVKCTYKNVDDIFETIIKSCFCPYVVDYTMSYKKKYIDGMNVYRFKPHPCKKMLYMELLSYDKFISVFNVKNEKTNWHRIMSGLLDIHLFFIKGSNTDMCSYVNEWSFMYKINHHVKYIIEKIIVNSIYFIYYFKKYVSKNTQKNKFIQLFYKMIYVIYCFVLDTYCF